MSRWRKLFSLQPAGHVYGLHPDNPVLCGGGAEGEIDYLERLRCPAGMPVRFERQGSLVRTRVDYLDHPKVKLAVSHGTRRRMGDGSDIREFPLDHYWIACDCGEHQEEIFIDMYFRGPELPIGAQAWILTEGIAPAEKLEETADCPYCGKELRTPAAKQCRFCKMDWHDPENVFQRDSKTK